MDKNSKPIQYIQRSIDRDRIAILKDLDRLFKDESRWTKGYWTRNSDSKRVALNSHDVSSYCLLGGLGSLRRQYTRAVVADTFDLLRHLANRMMPNLGINIKTGNMLDGVYCITRFNDAKQTKFAHIKQLISRAIRQAHKDIYGCNVPVTKHAKHVIHADREDKILRKTKSIDRLHSSEAQNSKLCEMNHIAG